MNNLDESWKEKFEIREEAFCEHCGDLEPYTLTWNNHTSWCISCARTELEFYCTPKFMEELRKQEKETKIKYFKECLFQLEEGSNNEM